MTAQGPERAKRVEGVQVLLPAGFYGNFRVVALSGHGDMQACQSKGRNTLFTLFEKLMQGETQPWMTLGEGTERAQRQGGRGSTYPYLSDHVPRDQEGITTFGNLRFASGQPGRRVVDGEGDPWP